MSQSAFFVRVPESEPLVADLRQQFDPVAALGVPAHVTLLYPFMPMMLANDDVLARAQRVLNGIAAFHFILKAIGRFPDTAYLAPEPAEPFVTLTQTLAREFPNFPPYGGRFSTLIPHLTVADKSAENAAIAERTLAERLEKNGAVRCECRQIELWENSTGLWRFMNSFALRQP